ncbi:class I SAM-dependent methyltransferase [Streptomyces nodosus]|uniref:Class I SAM-dependent methyltransferase n=1 Tax=Streptomyces nodosus TaxID=40318 RepID=A0A0B5D709_9ACTN|nr:class I SAM-dependent methyltransferase [Streptomyces nodosus]AJE39028.1 methyltransferase type 12 [Streptomyces nodosus]MBB4789878.1 SAM-dependent methyltransferase [Streptomyces nodosus]QEV37614.1 class I SAM-dependent methyltransferase [Streptomyces nodosus]
MTDTTALPPRVLLERWDAQQSAYVAHRELRFQSMLDVLRLALPESFHVLDLACGPGSLADRVLRAFPGARVTAVDYDPVLLRIAGEVLAEHGDRATVVDTDLVRADWAEPLAGERFDAVVSSTALHWLSPTQLLRAYTALADLLPPGAVFLNADHLRYGPEHQTLGALSERHDAEVQRTTFAAGADTWDDWYELAVAQPGMPPLAAEREQRFADRPPQPPAPLHFHLSALRTAGFTEAGTVWQYLDDYVVFARR